jgi:RimJ/RimL family protein N-acetyltransferase
MSVEIRAVPLQAPGVRLEPLSESHREGLRRAAADEAIWAHISVDASGGAFDPWFDAALDVCTRGAEAVWAVRALKDQAVVGSTRFLAIEAAHRRVEIGHTWYAPAVWGTKVNPACKWALMNYGFEALELNRIELKTDIRNLRSQAAIAKLGATREGVFRAHMVRRDGSLRDTVYFSVIRPEWPSVRDRLLARLEAPVLSKENI